MRHLDKAMEDIFNQPIGSLALTELVKSDYRKPTLQEVCDWLWNEKGICVTPPFLSADGSCYECTIQYIDESGKGEMPIKGSGGTREDAINDTLHIVLCCLNKPIDIPKEQPMFWVKKLFSQLSITPKETETECRWRSYKIALQGAAKLRRSISPTVPEAVATQEQKEAYQQRKWMIDAYINKYRKENSCPWLYGIQDPFVLHDHVADCFVACIVRYFTLEWNPYDVTDPCNSLEEKREEYCRQAAEDFRYYRKMPRYAIEYAIFVGLDGRKDNEGLFGQTDGKDEYSYTMPDELWETVKKIIKWEGETTD